MAEPTESEIRFHPPEEKVVVGKPEDLKFTPFRLSDDYIPPLRFTGITARHAPAIINLVNRPVDLASYDSQEKSPFDNCEHELIPEMEALSQVPPVELFRRAVNVFSGPGGPGLTLDVAQTVASAYLNELRRIYESTHPQQNP